MSRNDKSTAETADVGDALVASLGFEPTKGSKADTSDGAGLTDDLQDPMGEVDGAKEASTNGSGSGSGAKSGAKTEKASDGQLDGPADGEPKRSASNRTSGQKRGSSPNRKKRGRSRSSANGSSNSTKPSPTKSSSAKQRSNKKSPAGADVAKPTVTDEPAVPDESAVSEKAESVVAAGLDEGLKSKAGRKKKTTVPATTGEVPAVKVDEPSAPEAKAADEPEAKNGSASSAADQASVTAVLDTVPGHPHAKSQPASKAKAKKAQPVVVPDETPETIDVPGGDGEADGTDSLAAEPQPKLAPTRRVTGEVDRPSVWQEFFGNPFGGGRKMQARKVRRVIRHVDPWSVLTFSVLFHMCVFAALLLASVLVWNVAESAGTIEKVEDFILELGDYETFTIDGEVIFRAGVAIAGILTLASSVIVVLLAVLFNLLSDLIGGIRVTVIEEETVRYEPTSGGE